MADLPILFSGPMVRAILHGTKTQTRRVLKVPDRINEIELLVDAYGDYQPCWYGRFPGVGKKYQSITVPYSPGDRLWVRESFMIGKGYDDARPKDAPPFARRWYAADESIDNCDAIGKLRPSIHMPRWASRITLTVTDVRVQRVQDISDVDVVAEGAEIPSWKLIDRFDVTRTAGTDLFRPLWDSINAKRGFGWDENPWVAAYTFTVERRNIDAVKSEVNHG